jgi:hypothetical protein
VKVGLRRKWRDKDEKREREHGKETKRAWKRMFARETTQIKIMTSL